MYDWKSRSLLGTGTHMWQGYFFKKIDIIAVLQLLGKYIYYMYGRKESRSD
jgi:hypothetical protein